MPVLVKQYLSASSLPEAAWTILYSHAAAANTILPHAAKALQAEEQSQPVGPQLWLVCFSPHIEFILSCTEGPLGTYPVFIFTPIPFNELVGKDLDAPMSDLCQALLDAVGRQRVFSVFAVRPVTEAFVRRWSSLADIAPVVQPYYDAIFTFCTKKRLMQCKEVAASQQVTLHKSSLTNRNVVAVDFRRALPKDIDRVAILCRDFATTSYPFILSSSKARQEAAMLIKERNIWVLEITAEGEEPDITSITAATRKSKTVAAITKVFSKPTWRGLGCAEMLVRRACEELLVDYERVVLYVGKDNCAINVYRRVGFYDLGTDQTPVNGVEPWLEVGFDPTLVSLGHW